MDEITNKHINLERKMERNDKLTTGLICYLSKCIPNGAAEKLYKLGPTETAQDGNFPKTNIEILYELTNDGVRVSGCSNEESGKPLLIYEIDTPEKILKFVDRDELGENLDRIAKKYNCKLPKKYQPKKS